MTYVSLSIPYLFTGSLLLESFFGIPGLGSVSINAIHSSDMAKLGLLYMNGGTWKGERLLSEEWTKMAMEKDYSLGPDESGLIYSKGGMYGQSLMVMPSTHRVVAVQGFEADTGVIREVLRNFR